MEAIEKILKDYRDGKIKNIVCIAEYSNPVKIKTIEMQNNQKDFEKFACDVYDLIDNKNSYDKSFVKKIIRLAKSKLICKCIKENNKDCDCSE